MAAEAHATDAQPAPAPASRQKAVLREYLQLQAIAASRFSASLAGRLTVCAGFARREEELSLATTIAGGAFLGIEPDAQLLKTAIRHSTCDFMVNTLDEALRALKNELRKQKPLSVGLLGDPTAIVLAMVERGVQPDLIAATFGFEGAESEEAPERRLSAQTENALRQLAARGAIELDLENAAREDSRYVEMTWSAGNLADMRQLDQAALAWLPPEDSVRGRWLQQAGGTFHRHLPIERVMNVESDAIDSLLHALRSATPFSSKVSARWQDKNGAQQTADL